MRPAPERCIVCGDAPVPLLRRGDLALVRSPGCGLEWRERFPDDDELQALYGPGYLARWGAGDADALAQVRAMKHASYREFLREIRGHRGGGRLLDVGCAAGFLMEVAREQGFDVYGVERNLEAARLAQERFGDRVHVGVFEGRAFAGRDFDVVTLIDVFEHVADPALLLDAVRARLRPGGVLAAVLPNTASCVRRLLGARWPHYVAEHLYHWSPGSLTRYLSDHGFELRGLRTGVRKTFTGRYLAAYAACVGSWLPPGVGWLGDRRLRIATGEMLVVASPRR